MSAQHPFYRRPLLASPLGISKLSRNRISMLRSIDFSNLAYATRRDRRLILERFREKHGEIHFSGLRQRHVEAMLAAKSATPHAAKSFLKALRGVIAVGMRAGLCTA